ncbi:MAG: polymer-forming cytoskeletal protein, partial [Anaerolineae bacterium]|nr:polymer-forming cytoskeletal protein [Anaerolineae bacterium]
MKTILLSIGLSLILLFGVVTPAAAQNPFGNDRVIFGNNVKLGENEKVNGDLVVFGGNVTIPEGAEVSSDLLVWGGNVTVEGTIGGDVAVFGGNVDVEDTGHIGGDVATFGGNANIAKEAFVGGDVDAPFGNESNPGNNNNRRGESFGSHASAPSFFGRVAGFAINTVWNIALLLGLALIAWLVAAFLPEQVQRVSDTVSQTPLVSFGMGLVTAALSFILIFPMAVLIITICLAIVPIGFYTLLGVALLLGWIAIGQLIGDKLLTSMERPLPNFAIATVVGVVILTVVSRMPIIEIIPVIGTIFSFIGGVFGLIVALTGLGAVLLTRYGTQAYATGSSPLGGS